MTEPDRPTSRIFSAAVKPAATGKAEPSSPDSKAISTTSTALRISSTTPTLLSRLAVPFAVGQSLTTNYLATRASAYRHRRRSQFRLRHRRRGIHDGELHRELQRWQRPAGRRHCQRFEISHRLDRGRRLGICPDRPLAGPVRISVRGVPEDERDRARLPSPGSEPIRCTAPATSSCRSPAPA